MQYESIRSQPHACQAVAGNVRDEAICRHRQAGFLRQRRKHRRRLRSGPTHTELCQCRSARRTSPGKSIAPGQRQLLPPHIFYAAEKRCQVEWTSPASSVRPQRRGEALRLPRRSAPSQTVSCQVRGTPGRRAAAACWHAEPRQCIVAPAELAERQCQLGLNLRVVAATGGGLGGETAASARPCINKAKPKICSARALRGSRRKISSAILCASSGRFAFNASAARCSGSPPSAPILDVRFPLPFRLSTARAALSKDLPQAFGTMRPRSCKVYSKATAPKPGSV